MKPKKKPVRRYRKASFGTYDVEGVIKFDVERAAKQMLSWDMIPRHLSDLRAQEIAMLALAFLRKVRK